MATYTVNISGTFNATYAYLTINGTKITSAGKKTYSSKPTIKVYLSSYHSPIRPLCNVKINGTVVQEGEGEYTLSTEATTIDIVISQIQDTSTYLYFTADISFDPLVPYDGHNTNIGQVARQIEGGTVLIGGVRREVESGLTLVGGVSREVTFADSVQVVISGEPYNGRAYATINGSAVYNAGTYEYDKMPTISVYVAGANTSMSEKCKVTLDGQTVRGGKGTYNLTVDANKITIEFTNLGTRSMWYYACDITTE